MTISPRLIAEEARKVARAYRAWDWLHEFLQKFPPPDDGLHHPQVDAEELLVEGLVRAAHDMVRATAIDDGEMAATLVDVGGLTVDQASLVVRKHRVWLRSEV